MSAALEDLIGWIVRRLVDEPDAVRIERFEAPDATVLTLHVAPGDVGKVIGRQGRIIRALRTVARSAGGRSHERVRLELAE